MLMINAASSQARTVYKPNIITKFPPGNKYREMPIKKSRTIKKKHLTTLLPIKKNSYYARDSNSNRGHMQNMLKFSRPYLTPWESLFNLDRASEIILC